jgi:hypothetical protein
MKKALGANLGLLGDTRLNINEIMIVVHDAALCIAAHADDLETVQALLEIYL